VNAPEPTLPLPTASAPPSPRLFPILTASQIERIAGHGRRRAVNRGEALIEVGDKAVPFFVVVSG
jgi:hypothetical protein